MGGQLSKLDGAGRLAIKVLSDRLIEAAGGPEKATLVTRVDRPSLSKYRSTSDEHADRFMPLDVAAELTLDTASRIGPMVARHFAALCGHAVVRLPEARTGEAHRAFADVARETGDVLSAFAKAIADGRMDSLEGDDVRAEIGQAIEALLALDAVVAGTR